MQLVWLYYTTYQIKFQGVFAKYFDLLFGKVGQMLYTTFTLKGAKMNCKEKLELFGQEHLLKFADSLSKEELSNLEKQIEGLDFSYLNLLNKTEEKKECEITPLKAMTVDEIAKNTEEYFSLGLDAIKRGELAVVLVAGGMGTRLGSDSPKGCYNIGKTKDVFIFQRLFENTLEVVKQAGNFVHFFIMTSEKNDQETRAFLKAHKYFGYDENFVHFFVQEMAPCVSEDGKILLEEKGRVATSPNGNGGWFVSLLKDESARKALEKSNAKWVNIFAVDNVLQRIADPVFFGAILKENCEVGGKVIRKADPYEKVGVVCNKDGRPSVVEYIDLTEEMAHQTDENGERVYNFGVIFNYIFSLDMLYRVKDEKLPVHVVHKKVEYVNQDGNTVKPESPNAYKFEMLGVDMVELATSFIPYEVVREKEFAPIKNKTGVDSVESAQALLEKNGYEL